MTPSILQRDAAPGSSRRLLPAVAIAAALASFAACALPTTADAKTPGHEYCFHGTCHRVASLAETERMVGKDMVLNTSFYDDCKNDRYNPCGLTSSGEAFRPDRADNAASPIFPDGTTLIVFNPKTKGAAIVRVNNAGPYWGKRKLDVSRALADKLGFRKSGVADLKVRVLKAPTKAEATYKKNRSYPRLAGYVGQHASLSDALAGTGIAVAAATPRAPSIAVVVPGGKTPAVSTSVAAAVKAKPAAAGTVASIASSGATGKKGKANARLAAVNTPAGVKPGRLLPMIDDIRELSPLRAEPGARVRLADERPGAIWY